MCSLQRNSAKQNNADYSNSNTLWALVKYNSSCYLDLVKKAPVFVSSLSAPFPLISALRVKVAVLTRLSNKPTFPLPPKKILWQCNIWLTPGHFCRKCLIKSWRHATTVFQINWHWQAWRRRSKGLSPLFIPTHTLGITCLQGKRDY